MERLSEFQDSVVEWIQPRTGQRFYELRAGEAVLGSLSFRSSFGTLAIAEMDGGRWSFKRVGFLNPRVTVRVVDRDEDVAIYYPKFWGDGVIRFDDGRSFAWKPVNFWATQWAFVDSDGRSVLSFQHGREHEKLSDIFKTQATVEIRPVEASRDLLPVLVPLGLYLIILHQQDAAAAVAATSSAV
jgi:hypothetical protein